MDEHAAPDEALRGEVEKQRPVVTIHQHGRPGRGGEARLQGCAESRDPRERPLESLSPEHVPRGLAEPGGLRLTEPPGAPGAEHPKERHGVGVGKHDDLRVAAQAHAVEVVSHDRVRVELGRLDLMVAADAPRGRTKAAAMGHAGHGAAAGGLGDRLYTVNPSHPDMTDIAENPANVPLPIARREPATVRVDLETREIEAPLDTNGPYRFWTFNGTVPGPMVRVRMGDTVEVHLRNDEESWYQHNIDVHAATGPGGGAAVSTANPGIYVHHCAVPPVALHISIGMYGLILVEPEEGLPPVDREFYVMQGEIHTEEPLGSPGLLTESYDKLLDERAPSTSSSTATWAP